MTYGGLSPDRSVKLRADAEASACCSHMDNTAVLALLDECESLRHLVTLMREWRDAWDLTWGVMDKPCELHIDAAIRTQRQALRDLLAHHDRIEQAKETA